MSELRVPVRSLVQGLGFVRVRTLGRSFYSMLIKTLLLTWTRTWTHVRSLDTELASYPPISSVRRRHSTMSIYISGRISQTINYPNELKLNPQRRACANTHIKNTPKTQIRTVLNIRRKRNIRSVVRRFQKSVLDRIHVLQIRRAPKLPSILVKWQYNILIGVAVELI